MTERTGKETGKRVFIIIMGISLAVTCWLAMPDARGESIYLAEPMLRRISRVDLDSGEHEVLSGIVWEKRFVDLVLDGEGLVVVLETEEPAVHTLRMTEVDTYEQVSHHRIPGGYLVPDQFIIDENNVLRPMVAGPVALTVARNGHYIIIYSFAGVVGRRPGYIVDYDPGNGRSEVIGEFEHEGRLVTIIEEDEEIYIIASPTTLYRWEVRGGAGVTANLSQERDGVALGWITDLARDGKGNYLVSGHTIGKEGEKGYPTIASINRQDESREILLDDSWHSDPDPGDFPDLDLDGRRENFPGLFDFTELTIQGIGVDDDGVIFFTTFWDHSYLAAFGNEWPPSPMIELLVDLEDFLASEEAVMRFDPVNGDIRFILGGFRIRPEEEQPRLLDPRDLIIVEGQIIVADHNTVKEIPPEGGSFVERYYESFGWGPLFFSPENIATDPADGSLLVTDSYLNAVFRVDPLSGDRTLFSGSTGPGHEEGEGPELILPWDVEVERDGSLLVTGREYPIPEWGCCFAGVLYRIDPSGDREILSPRQDGRASGDPWVDPRWLSVHPCLDRIAVADTKSFLDEIGMLYYLTAGSPDRERIDVNIGHPIAYGLLGDLYYATDNAVLKNPLQHRLVSGEFLGSTRGDGQDYTRGHSRDIAFDSTGMIFVLKENVLDISGRYSPNRILTTIGRSPTLPDTPSWIFRIDPETGDREIIFDCQTAEELDGHPPLPESMAVSGFGFPDLSLRESEPDRVCVDRLEEEEREAFEITLRGSGFPDGMGPGDVRFFLSASGEQCGFITPVAVRWVNCGEVTVIVSLDGECHNDELVDIRVTIADTGESSVLERAFEVVCCNLARRPMPDKDNKRDRIRVKPEPVLPKMDKPSGGDGGWCGGPNGGPKGPHPSPQKDAGKIPYRDKKAGKERKEDSGLPSYHP